MSTLRQKLDRRNTLIGEMRALSDQHPDGALPPDAQQRWDALRTESDALQAAIERQAIIDEGERRAAATPLGGTGDNRLDAEVRQVGLIDVIRAQMGGTDTAAGRAREVSAELARRAGRQPQGAFWHMGERRVIESTGTGANVVATNLDAAAFINRLYAATRVRQLGATVLNGLVGNVDIPKLAGSTTAGWVAEGSPLTASDATFTQVQLKPKTAGIVAEYSRNMLLQATPDIEALLRADMARMLAITLDQAAVSGPGTGNAPTGVLSTSGIGTVALGTDGAPLAYDNFVDLMGQVQDQNAELGALAFLTNYKVRRAAQKLKTTTNEPLGEAVVFQNMPRAFTTGVPSNLTKGSGTNLSALLYGNWSDLLIGMWSELDILVNPYDSTSYLAGNVKIRAMMSVDIEVRHPESFAAITDAVA
jgi:HK97 family phage major capsid protein